MKISSLWPKLIVLIVVLSPHIGVESGGGGVLPHGSIPYAVPALIVLLILAIPPILTSTYAGLQAVDPATRDAAVGTGMTAAQTAVRVELPCALPLIMSGVRSATLQVVATTTMARTKSAAIASNATSTAPDAICG